MSMYIGVDGGQSGLRLAVAGTELSIETEGLAHSASNPLREQLAAIEDCWEQLGRPGPVDVVALGLTGRPTNHADQVEFAAAVGAKLDAKEVRHAPDMVTAHFGALPQQHGVVVAAGTGVACLGADVNRERLHRVDAWGHLFGDNGSAFAVGSAGIAAVMREHDGRGAPTALTDLASQRYGDIADIPREFYRSRRLISEVARFAVDVEATARNGDPIAQHIVGDATSELICTVAAAAEYIGGAVVPVAGTGRWFDIIDAYTDVAEKLDGLPRCQVRSATGNGLVGACRLAEAPSVGVYAPMILTYYR